MLEYLERRLLRHAALSGGVLTATGLSSSDSFFISLSSGGTAVVVTHTAPGGHSDTLGFPLASVNSIVVNAGDGNDTVNLSPAVTRPATLNGGNGDDVLRGGGAGDTLDGGPGADRLDGGAGADTYNGGDGADTADYSTRSVALTIRLDGLANDGSGGGAERDNVHADVENVTGGSGADSIIGGPAANVIRGGGGNDLISGSGGNDTLDGGGGADSLSGGDGDDTLRGGETGTAPGTLYADTFSGGPGSDTADYSARGDGINVRFDDLPNDGRTGEADDVKSDVENAIGSGGADALYGSAATNRLDGRGGNDYVRGSLSDANAASGAGADTLLGGDGDDFIDAIFTTAGKTLDGGAGDDRLRPGYGNDRVVGGPGTGDTADYGYRSKPLLLSLDGLANDGEDPSLGGRDESDNLLEVEHLTGGSARDTIVGNALANVLRGGGNNDTITGAGGPDQLFGDAGDDRFLARDGAADQIFGGAGTDSGDFDSDDLLDAVP